MVMFHEDDRRLRKKPGRVRTWLTRIIVAAMIAFFGFSLMLSTLGGLGGPRAPLRKGLEEYLSQVSGYAASIGEFRDMQFYPDFMIDAGDISFTAPGGEEVAHIGSVTLARPFFDQILMRNRFITFAVKDMRVNAGIVSGRRLELSRMGFTGKGPGGPPALTGEGRYGDDAVRFSIDMKTERDRRGRVLYAMLKDRPFRLALGELRAEGMTANAGLSGLRIVLDRLSGGGDDAHGDFMLKTSRGGFRLKGFLEAGASRIEPDFGWKKGALDGSLLFSRLALEDVGPVMRLIGIVTGYLPASGKADNPRLDLGASAMDMSIVVQKLRAGGQDIGDLNIPAKIAQDVLTLGPLKGSFSGGVVSGGVTLDASKKPARAALKLAVRGLDYGRLQKTLYGRTQAGGSVDIHADLNGAGDRIRDIYRALEGEIVLVAGESATTAPALDVWNIGLVGAMAPGLGEDAEMKLACFIADFTVKGGVATAAPLFADTDALAIEGKGRIDLPEQAIDMVFTPQPKSAALLKLAAPVRVEGPLAHPRIAPEKPGAVKKIADPAALRVSPAFLLFGPDDLGLGETHSCHAYLAGKKKE
jgi:hypothetical protein